ncbi:hypothetical protein REMIM1_PE00085 (plasmid) [Rhizobium etli bv. mimosae str. Mim1]|nr:hypothetical protein REMIM1_PE00085 [Rhizobium etli bv. mimosae str. Mim1]
MSRLQSHAIRTIATIFHSLLTGNVQPRLSELGLDVGNLTPHAATKCLLSLRNSLRHTICVVQGVVTNLSAMGLCDRARVNSCRRFAGIDCALIVNRKI